MGKKTSKLDFYKKKFVTKRTHDDDEDIPSEDDEVVAEAKQKKAADDAEAKQKRIEKQKKEEKRQQEKQRRRQLKQANEEEKQNISKLEKQLGLKRRKSKNLPKSFAEDGLDYLINVSDSTKIEALGQDLSEEEDDEDFVKKIKLADADSDESDQEKDSDEEMDDMIEKALQSDEDEAPEDSEEEVEDDTENFEEENMEDASEEDDEAKEEEGEDEEVKEEGDGVWEDIYGRRRSREGAVLAKEAEEEAAPAEEEEETSAEAKPGKYVPPGARRKALGESAQKKVELERLARQLKGQVNRLAESNLPGIARFIEGTYRQHARNDVNQAVTDLLVAALVLPTLTPARLVMEHVMLVAVLHANIGTEVGAHFLQSLVRSFSTSYTAAATTKEATKHVHNLLLVISYVYSFRLVDAGLVFDILHLLADSFHTLEVELILLVLRNCGFALRKDDSSALKSFILKVQAKAAGCSGEEEGGRVTFMLEVLMAIKNNNMSKIPNYDPSHFDHLRKSLRTLVREGNSVTELRIGYKELLAAETSGRWWIVGSAFTGALAGGESAPGEGGKVEVEAGESGKLLELARKMRMNTDIRRNIFCLLMTAEDYMDATERLVKLGTKNQVEREVLFVITDCCVQEKVYNPYYGHLAAKLASIDRRYRVAGQFTIWDKLKQAGQLKRFQLSNLGHLTSFLIQEKAQSLGILKVIEFAEMNKVNVRFLKQVLVGLLLGGSKEEVVATFQAVSASPALSQFREQLRLFLHHFLLRPGAKLDAKVDRDLLGQRVEVAEAALLSASTKLKL